MKTLQNLKLLFIFPFLLFLGCASMQSELGNRLDIPMVEEFKLIDHSTLAMKETDEVYVFRYRSNDLKKYIADNGFKRMDDVPVLSIEHRKFLKMPHDKLGEVPDVYWKKYRTNIPNAPQIHAFINLKTRTMWITQVDSKS